METISNLTAAASKAVWGDNQTANKEPVSGVQGDTKHGEPYDAGNLETPQQEKVAQNFGSHGEERATGLGHEAPDLHDVDDTSEGTDVKLGEGPGPRPIEKLAKEHGGDAGNAPVEGTSHKPTEVGSEGATESTKSENQPHDPKEDEYVTASGFAADGGDFDASKPGAGREADRLMEQKGIHLGESESSDHSKTESHSSGKHHRSDEKKDKPSIGERIKAKLHKH
ncbi:hypothetical protein BKA60DRAFT_590011 [Fusarium oxysporum]|nr:hypothetical protein BKA60DRAFT_590011 [Fusarium oxysporum]